MYAGHRHQGGAGSHTAWLSKADWIPKLVSLQKGNERKQKLCISQALQDYLLPFHSLPNLTVTKSQAQIEWYDLLIQSAVLLKISRSFFFFPVVRLTKLSFDFPCKSNLNLLKKEELWGGRVLSYWFLHISSKGMLYISAIEDITVSPWYILIGLQQYPGRCLLNMLAVQWEQSKWTCLDCDWFSSLRH